MSSLASAPPHFQDADDSDVLIQFEDTAFEPTLPSENFEDQVREAQEQLAELRQREEQLERQKQELEELHERKAAFIESRLHANDDLNRAINSLSREAEESQRRADQCLNTKESLEHCLRTVESLRPEMWSRSQLKEELARGQSQLSDAEEELRGAAPLLSSISGTRGFKLGTKRIASSSQENGQSFLYWFKSGLAFTLPVMIFIAVFGMIFLIFGGS